MAIYLDTEALRLDREVEGGWKNIRGFGVAVAVIFDDEKNGYDVYLGEKKEDMEALKKRLEEAESVVGFNIIRYDYEVLAPYLGDLAHLEEKTFDILDYITERIGKRVSLNNVAKHTLGRKKKGYGIQMPLEWRAGKRMTVIRYCKNDVELVKDVYLFGKKNGYIMYFDPESLELDVRVEEKVKKLEVEW